MSKADEGRVSADLENSLEIHFKNSTFSLDGWGKVDNWCQVSPSAFVFLEVETQQKHPNTNVLKVWPFLEQKPEKNVFLIQVFFPNSPGLNSSRGKLGEWTAKKLEALLPGRFFYEKLVLGSHETESAMKRIKGRLSAFKQAIELSTASVMNTEQQI